MLSTMEIGAEEPKREEYNCDDIYKECGRDEEIARSPKLQRANVLLNSTAREATTVVVNRAEGSNEEEEKRYFETRGSCGDGHTSDKRSCISFRRDSIDNYAPSKMYSSNHPEDRTDGRCRRASSISSPPIIIWPRVDPNEYHMFYWDCMELKSELIRLDFALRSVGSGGPLIQATYAVKLAVMKLRDLYGMNTSALAPEDENVKVYNPSGSFVYLREFPSALVEFGDALDDMAQALHDFNTVYHDEKLMLQLFSLHSRFKADAATLSLDNDFRSAPTEFAGRMQLLIGEWLKEAVTSLTSALRTFTDKGIPAIQVAQNSMTSRYLNMTTIAFFLSGTTASMLQITADSSENSLGAAANTCLFSSLVFSVGSAVNSLLANGWRKSVVRDPDATLPLWSKIWLNAGPMISLLLSGALFAAGVCLFVVASEHASWTSAITLAFTGFHVSGLMFLFGFFIQERWHFRKNAGSVGRVLTGRSFLLSGMDWANSRVTRLGQSVRPKASLDVMETGVGILTKSMDEGKEVAEEKGEGEVSSESERSPGAVWHALSDEKFLLSSKYIFSPVIVRPRSRSRSRRFPRSRRYTDSRSPVVQSPGRVVIPDPGRWLSRIESSHSRNSSHSSLHEGVPTQPTLPHMDHAVMSSLFVQPEPPARVPPCQAPPCLPDNEGMDRWTEASVDDHANKESQAADTRPSLPVGSRPEGLLDTGGQRRMKAQEHPPVTEPLHTVPSDENGKDDSESNQLINDAFADCSDLSNFTVPPRSDGSHFATGSRPLPVPPNTPPTPPASVPTKSLSTPVREATRRNLMAHKLARKLTRQRYKLFLLSLLRKSEKNWFTRRNCSPDEDKDRSSYRACSAASPTRYAGGRDGNEPLHHSEENADEAFGRELTDCHASPMRYPRTNYPRHGYSLRPDSPSQVHIAEEESVRPGEHPIVTVATGASAVVQEEEDEEDRGRSRRCDSPRVHRSRINSPSSFRSPRYAPGARSRSPPLCSFVSQSLHLPSPPPPLPPLPPPPRHYHRHRPSPSPPTPSSGRRYRGSLNHYDLRAGNDYGSAMPPLRVPPSPAPPIRAFGNVQSAALFLPSSSLHRASQPQRHRGNRGTRNG